jgi:hypothetical protein
VAPGDEKLCKSLTVDVTPSGERFKKHLHDQALGEGKRAVPQIRPAQRGKYKGLETPITPEVVAELLEKRETLRRRSKNSHPRIVKPAQVGAWSMANLRAQAKRSEEQLIKIAANKKIDYERRLKLREELEAANPQEKEKRLARRRADRTRLYWAKTYATDTQRDVTNALTEVIPEIVARIREKYDLGPCPVLAARLTASGLLSTSWAVDNPITPGEREKIRRAVKNADTSVPRTLRKGAKKITPLRGPYKKSTRPTNTLRKQVALVARAIAGDVLL